MNKIVVALAVTTCIGLLAGCTASQPIILAREVKAIEEVTNKQIAFERLSHNDLNKDIAAESGFLKSLFGYNYWKTSEGYIFVISGGPAGTPGHGIKVKSVEEDKEGKTIISVEQTSPPQGEMQQQVVTFPIAIYSVHATNENFVVRNQDGKEFPRYPKNEFTVTGTVTEIITLKDWLYPPHYIRVIPDVEGDRMNGSYFVDFVQFSISNSASKQAKELSKGDKVSLVYSVGGMSDFNIKSVTKLGKAVDNTAPTTNQATVSKEEAGNAVVNLCSKPDIDVKVLNNKEYDITVDGVKYYYFDIFYGTAMAKSPVIGDDTITRAFVNNKDKTVYRAVKDNTDKWSAGSKITKDTLNSVSELNYNDLVIKVGMDSKAILDKIGNGSATEDNNYGFVGWSEDNKYKYYYHDYVSFSLYTKVNVADGTSVIDKIILNDTKGINKCMDIAAKVVGIKDWKIKIQRIFKMAIIYI